MNNVTFFVVFCEKNPILVKIPLFNALTRGWNPHIIEPVRMLLRCSPVFCFYPHFIKRNLGQEAGCHAPVLCTPGDGRKFPPGTGLLNIAGEKIEDSGILGYSSVLDVCMILPRPFFVLVKSGRL